MLAIKIGPELEIESFENKLSCGVGMPKHDQTIAGLEALTRLIEIAQKDTGQSRRVADFLLAWHNAAENGGCHRFVECGPEYRRRYVHGLASHSRGTAISRRPGFQG